LHNYIKKKLMIFRKIYTFWAIICFATLFFLCLPILFFLPARPPFFSFVGKIHNLWARLSYFFWGISYEVEYLYKPKKNEAVIYCANHNSVIDIVSMGALIPHSFAFVGKDELAKVPLFGKIFAKFHVAVKRESLRDAYKAIRKSQEILRQKRSLMVFPEGSRSRHSPVMRSFKDGAFRIAIAEQAPIVPVTLLFNWKILPNDGTNLAKRHHWKAIIHQPIQTKGMKVEDLEILKKEVYQVIEKDLLPFYPEKNLGENNLITEKTI